MHQNPFLASILDSKVGGFNNGDVCSSELRRSVGGCKILGNRCQTQANTPKPYSRCLNSYPVIFIKRSLMRIYSVTPPNNKL